MMNERQLTEATRLAERLRVLLTELDRHSLIDPESLGHLVAARELVEEAAHRLAKVRPRRWA